VCARCPGHRSVYGTGTGHEAAPHAGDGRIPRSARWPTSAWPVCRRFRATTFIAVAMAHVYDEPPRLPADVPAAVRDVVRTAMVKDPARRYPTGAAHGRPPHDGRPNRGQPLVRPGRCRPSTATTARLATGRAGAHHRAPPTRRPVPYPRNGARSAEVATAAASLAIVGIAISRSCWLHFIPVFPQVHRRHNRCRPGRPGPAPGRGRRGRPASPARAAERRRPINRRARGMRASREPRRRPPRRPAPAPSTAPPVTATPTGGSGPSAAPGPSSSGGDTSGGGGYVGRRLRRRRRRRDPDTTAQHHRMTTVFGALFLDRWITITRVDRPSVCDGRKN